MTDQTKKGREEEPVGAEGVPVDAPDNSAPAISPQATSRMPRAEDDRETWRHSPEFSDEREIAIEDRGAGEAWIPGRSSRDQHIGREQPAAAEPARNSDRRERQDDDDSTKDPNQ